MRRLRAGMDLAVRLQGGMCSTCRAHLTEGDAPMEVNYSLEPCGAESGFYPDLPGAARVGKGRGGLRSL